MECQNRTISRGSASIFSRLRKEGIDVSRRRAWSNWGELKLMNSPRSTWLSSLWEDGVNINLVFSRLNKFTSTERPVSLMIVSIPLLPSAVFSYTEYVTDKQDSFYVDLQTSTREVNGVTETPSYCLSLGTRIWSMGTSPYFHPPNLAQSQNNGRQTIQSWPIRPYPPSPAYERTYGCRRWCYWRRSINVPTTCCWCGWYRNLGSGSWAG